jgi:hypothetical protein
VGRSKSRPVVGSQVVEYSGEKGLWSVAEEALLPRGAFGGESSAFGGWGSFAAALLEAVAVAVHLQDVDVVGEAVEQAPVSRSEPRTSVHSWKGRLLVTSVEPRS